MKYSRYGWLTILLIIGLALFFLYDEKIHNKSSDAGWKIAQIKNMDLAKKTPLKTPLTEEADESSGFPHEYSDLKPDSRILYGRLENGMRYAIMHGETPKNTASLRLFFATGSFNETDEQRGIAHFLEHMAFNGSENIPEEEMVKIFERLGMSFGRDTNASTSFDNTVYKLDLPETSDELVDTAFMVMRETVSRLKFDPSAIERERGSYSVRKTWFRKSFS